MRTSLDVRHVIDGLVESRRARIRSLGAVVEVEDALTCSGAISEETVSDVFGRLLDHILGPAAPRGQRIQIGWLPTSDATRVFYVTNSARPGPNGSADEIAPGPTDEQVSPPVREAQARVVQEGGRLWMERSQKGGSTFFFVFGSNGHAS